MTYDFSRHKILTRRTILLGSVQIIAYSFLLGRLAYLQIFKRDEYQRRSDANRVTLRFTPPQRGAVFDKRNQYLISNRSSFDVIFMPGQLKKSQLIIKELQSLLHLDKAKIKKINKAMGRSYGQRSILIKEHLNWEQLTKIEVRSPHLPGVSIEEKQERFYPLETAASMITGYVGEASSQERKRNDYSRMLPDFEVGKTGLEKEYDHSLYGVPGFKKIEVNAKGHSVKLLEKQNSVSGEPLYTTLDSRLQKYLYEKLSVYKSASAVVLNAQTGGVLGLASYPFYNANKMVQGLSHAEWKRLQGQAGDPMVNKALSGQYPPASIFKLVVATAALESSWGSHKEINCPGYLYLGSHKFHCWKKHGHGTLNLRQAVEQSCDVYFYHLARRIGIDSIARIAKILGFGGLTSIDLPGEQPGLVPTRKWKKERFGEPWYPGDSMNAGIGQGYLLVTPLQIAMVVARISNGGIAVTPTINQALLKRRLLTLEPLSLSKKTLAFIKRTMIGVMDNPTATGFSTRLIGHAGMGGKSGTAQVRRISKRERDSGKVFNKYKKWRYQDHALFTGFAPSKNPRYVVSVVLEHGGWGGRVAGPVARDILQKCLTLNI